MRDRPINAYPVRRLIRANRNSASEPSIPAVTKIHTRKDGNCDGPRGSIAAPAVVVTLIIREEAEEPLRVTLGDAALHVARAGAPVHDMVTDCVDPLTGVTIKVNDVFWPWLTVCVPGAALIEKSGAGGGGGGLTFCVTVLEVLGPSPKLPANEAVMECDPNASAVVA